MKTPSSLTHDDLRRIETAVKDAEKSISGEIVPVLFTRSHHYPSAKYKFALLFSFVTFILVIIADRVLPGFNLYDPLYYFTLVFGAAILGFLIPVLFPSLAVAVATEGEKRHAAYQKAETIFLEKEIFNTKQRSGIMIFVSFEEHQVIVMADSGINAKVDQQAWDFLVAKLVEHIKNKKIVDGLTIAIEKCGEILLENGFSKSADDANELQDNLIKD